jgi:GNAT superfamily N-acetyltransferase
VPEIAELDPQDDSGLRELYGVDRAAFRADHPHAVLRTFTQLVQVVRRRPQARAHPDARRRGIGRALKAAVVRILAAEHPERRLLHTWNAVENTFMQRINRKLGVRPVERELEMQRPVADA